MQNQGYRHLFKKYFSFVCLGTGGIFFLLIWFVFPKSSSEIIGIHGLIKLVAKIFVFVTICLGIGFFPNKSKNRYLLLLAPVVFYLGFIIPRLSYFGFFGVAATDAISREMFYAFLYFITFPSILLSIAFSFRLGGGTPGNTIKIALSGVIILFSGFLDLMWFVVNPVSFPDVMQYAHHIRMVLGHYPSYKEGIIFAICHLPILILLLMLPLDKWLNKVFPEA